MDYIIYKTYRNKCCHPKKGVTRHLIHPCNLKCLKKHCNSRLFALLLILAKNQDLCQGKGKLISPDNSPVSSKITRGNEASAIPASLALYQNSPQNCQNDQQCKNIDETWLKVSNLIGGPLSGKVWDTKTNTPKDFNEVHVPPPTQTLPQTQTPTPTPTPIGNLADCKVTPINSPSSEAVGKSNDGSLKNGVLLRGSPSKYLIVLKGDKRGEHSYGTQELVNLLEH